MTEYAELIQALKVACDREMGCRCAHAGQEFDQHAHDCAIVVSTHEAYERLIRRDKELRI